MFQLSAKEIDSLGSIEYLDTLKRNMTLISKLSPITKAKTYTRGEYTTVTNSETINVGDTVVIQLFSRGVLVFYKVFVSEYYIKEGSSIIIGNNKLYIENTDQEICGMSKKSQKPDTLAIVNKKHFIFVEVYFEMNCFLNPDLSKIFNSGDSKIWSTYILKIDRPLVVKKTLGTPVYPSQSVSNLHSESSLNNLNLLPVSQTYLLKPTTYTIKIIQSNDGYQEVYCLY